MGEKRVPRCLVRTFFIHKFERGDHVTCLLTLANKRTSNPIENPFEKFRSRIERRHLIIWEGKLNTADVERIKEKIFRKQRTL